MWSRIIPPSPGTSRACNPLRAALVGCVVVTAVGGVLSSPLFDWASSTVAGTPILQQAIAAAAIAPLA